MFYRRFWTFGKIHSDEGFKVWYEHETARYEDGSGVYEIGFEDGFLFSQSLSRIGRPMERIVGEERTRIIDRILRGLQWDGQQVTVFESERPR